ncbi:hypothetical protein KJY73_05575 [Bowmanella sp. Y26]|uniref:hypothetical protein n=1 Tax=Bowmanella yangjiangensis TaxID=2811230 RepID=UPI001BDCA7AF|nr:hypothetical protein [Bowmanella yangjiangensis]MBT1063035.1 hypothetical protein [Bowmanella yangjiangensis]
MKFVNWLWKTIKSLTPYLIFLSFGILCWNWFKFTAQTQADLAEPIVNGVIGGVVTSILILIFTILWKSNITPWIENLLYKDTRLEGVWNGVLVPYIGIEEIDKRRIDVAFGIVERRRRKRKKAQEEGQVEASNGNSLAISATSKDNEVERDIDAELIFKEPVKSTQDEDESELIDRKIFLKIGSGMAPIEVRVEIKRVGHSIFGQIVEIGGASDIHTYSVKGSFKNLILTGEYENQDCSHIDRGSLSLMLRGNGRSLEGFFSSYDDGEHHMAPFKCVLKRQDRNANGE